MRSTLSGLRRLAILIVTGEQMLWRVPQRTSVPKPRGLLCRGVPSIRPTRFARVVETESEHSWHIGSPIPPA